MSQILKIGLLLDHGKYRVEKVLGQGGFGITYLVTDIGLDKLRALKEFFPKDYCERDETTSHVSLGTTNTAQFVNRLKAKFIKEARNIANLDQHHGIIKIHTVFEENNTAYYIMDYIDGESLSSMVKRSGPVPVDKAVRYITEVGEALEYVHKHKINHLDVKPANIMIRKKDDKPILIDFGLAKQYDSEGLQTSTTPTGISHGFAPFEQYRDGGVKEFSPQTDVYSLAATLYYIVSGQIPPHATDLIENTLNFPAAFPESLKEPIRKAMSSKRLNRPESVLKFLESLNQRDNHARNDSKNSHQDEETIIEQPIGKKPGESGKDKDPQPSIPDPKINKKNNPSWLYIGVSLLIVILCIIFIPLLINKISNVVSDITTENVDSIETANGKNELTSNTNDDESYVWNKTESGLKYKILREGTGKSPKWNDQVTVHYEGKLPDGTIFDSSYERGEPSSFPLERVIPGWTEGLQLMKIGGKTIFHIPSNLAFGADGCPPIIPPHSDLIFTVELLSIN